MAKRTTLTCLEKRDLLSSSREPAETFSAWGRVYEERALVHDAVDFYEKAGDTEALSGLLEKVRAEGDAFLFGRLCRVLGREAGAHEWLSVAERAEALGKDMFAAQAYRKAGADDKAERVHSGVPLRKEH